MASGVAVSDDCVTKYQELKLGKALRYITYKITDDLKEIVVDQVAQSNTSWDDFVATLPKGDCRYAVYDFEYTADDGGKRNKILFILWSPEGAKVKPKMLYTSSKDGIRKKLVGIGTEIQATGFDEVDHAAVTEKVLRK